MANHDHPESLYRSIAANLPGIVFSLDAQGIFTTSDGRGLEKVGLKPGQLVGTSVYEIYKDVPEIPGSVKRAMAGESHSSIAQIGDVIFDIWYAPILDENEKIIGVLGNAHDITQQKTIENALKQGEERWHNLFESAPNAMLGIDKHGKIVLANHNALMTFGYSHEELLGKSIEVLVPHSAQKAHVKFRQDFTAAPTIRDMGENRKLSATHKDGSEFPVQVGLGHTMLDGEVLVIATIIDISSQKKAEEQAELEKERFRLLADFAYGWETWLNPEGRFEYVSPSCERISGYHSSEFKNNPGLFSEIAHPDDKELVARHLQAHKTQKTAEAIEYRIITKDRKVRWISHVCQPIYDKNNQWQGRRGSNLDITDKKEIETERQLGLERIQAQQAGLVALSMDVDVAEGNIQRAFAKITENIARTTETERVSIWLLSENAQEMACIDLFEKGKNRHSSGVILTATDYPQYFASLVTGRAIDAHDAHTDPRTSEFSKGYLTPLGINSMLDSIIRMHGQVVGVVCQEHIGPQRTWKTDEISYAGAVADHVALAMLNREQRAANNNLRESQQRLSLLVESSPLGLIEWDTSFRVTFWNPAAERIFGYTQEEAMGRHASELVIPLVEKEVVDNIWQAVLNQRGGAQSTNTNSRKDGQIITCDWFNTPLIGEDGQVFGVASLVQDVTEQKQAETKLRESEEQYRRAIAAADAVPYYIDYQAEAYRFVGEGIEAMTGYTAREMTPQLMESIIKETIMTSKRGIANRDTAIADVRTGKVADWRADYHIITKDGNSIWLSDASVQVMDEENKPIGAIGILQDITSRKLAEEAVRESQQRLSLLVEGSPLGVIEWNINFEVTSWNPAAENIFGYSRQEAMGKNAVDLIIPDEAKNLVNDIWKELVNQTGGTRSANNNVRKDGNNIICEWFNTPLIDEYGNVFGVASLVMDITEQKTLEEQIRNTLDLRGKMVETSGEVAQEIATAQDLSSLMESVVTLVKERFGYYHTQVFRYNANVNAVVLVHGYGEAGKRMLKAKHRIEMGRGVVGIAAYTGNPVLVTDVTSDVGWRPNPELPNTKGELAVPIKFQNEILGILDVQSDVTNALTQDDQLLMENLAGQIGIAMENTRLRQEMSERLEEIESLYRSITRTGWHDFQSSTRIDTDIFYDPDDNVDTNEVTWYPEFAEVAETRATIAKQAPGEPVITPLAVRGELIGALGVISDPVTPLSDEDISMLESISEQVALALESARLFAETQAKEENFRNLIENAPEAIIVVDMTTGLFADPNENAVKLYGLPKEELIKFSPADLSPEYQPDGILSSEGIITRMQEALAGSTPTFEWVHTNAKKENIPCEIRLSRLPGDAPMVRATVTDITERKEAEEALRRSEESLRRRSEYLASATEVSRLITSTLDLPTLFDRTVNLLRARFGYYHVAIFLIDESGYNAIYEEGTGEAGESLKEQKYKIAVGGKTIVGTVTSQSKTVIINNTALDPLYQVQKLLPETRAEACVPLRVGQRTIGALDIHASYTGAFHDEEVGVLETLADSIAVGIDNARSYERSQLAAEELREADRIKTQFLANMSHELRTPLNSIIGFSRVILKGIDGPVTEQQQQDLSAIYASGQHLLGLINDILDHAKIEAGKMELAIEEINVTDTITSVMSTAMGLVKDKPVRLVKAVGEGVTTVRADGMRLRQVLINLISNASKFTEEGSITISAEAQVNSLGVHEVLLSVTDTGPGISPEDQQKLFLAFSQVDSSATRKTGGTGLGLSICKMLVEMHQGRIGVHSTVGKGSTFYFTIPAFNQPKTDALPGEGKLILCIDDDPQITNLYDRYLTAQGYKVIAVSNPAEAKEAVKKANPYAVTLDIMMPEIDGWHVLEELKSDPDTRNYPVIVCSIVEEEEKGFSLGAADYLVKPIMEDDLLRALTSLNGDGSISEVLVIDDSPDDLRLIEKVLSERSQFKPILAEGGHKGWEILSNNPPNAVILDLFMPDLDGFAILERMRSTPELRDIPVVVVSGVDLSPEQKKQLDNLGKRLLQKGMLSEEELFSTLEKALKRLETRK